MAGDLVYRRWGMEAPDYGDDPDKFTLAIEHGGIFTGLHKGGEIDYYGGSLDFFDHCNCDTWSLLWIHDFLIELGCEITEALNVYWCLPGKELKEGCLVCIEQDSDIVSMIVAAKKHKVLNVLVDHGNYLKGLRPDVILNFRPVHPPVGNVNSGSGGGLEQLTDANFQSGSGSLEKPTNGNVNSGSGCGLEQATNGNVNSGNGSGLEQAATEIALDNMCESEESEGEETDSDFYDSDYDVEDDNDDIWEATIDKDVDDNNEDVEMVEEEDDAGYDYEELNLSKEQEQELKYKFKMFNAEADMEVPQFKVGMVFSCMPEIRKAIKAYSINERVRLQKVRNEQNIIHVVCKGKCATGECTWFIKASKDTRTEAVTVRKYCGAHRCEKVWELKALTSSFIAEYFIEEFRDNQKMNLQTFSNKIQKKFNLTPNRWKLRRARRKALIQIHGDEAEQFSLLCDYGQESRTKNPGSNFFLTTNQSTKDGEVKEHLATLYWSYAPCKRGFLEGCRPFICIDGCHIKTRYMGILLTAVGIDPNDCIYPLACGVVEVECTSSWEWFLTTLRDDLGITNTSTFTIMSDKQKGLIKAVKKVFPDSEHRFCVRHLYQNFHKKNKGETLKNDLWSIARATNIPQWKLRMEKLQADSQEAWAWVEELQPNTWIKAFFSDFQNVRCF